MEPITDPDPPGDVFMLGYSRAPGHPVVHRHNPEYHDRIKGVFSWAGAVGGSIPPTASTARSRIYPPRGPRYVSKLLSVISPAMLNQVGVRRLDEYDVKGAMNDLRTDVREAFNKKHAGTSTASESRSSRSPPPPPTGGANINSWTRCASSEYDANNDMQLTQKQSLLPIGMNTHVAMAHAHHWDVAYAAFPLAMRAMSPNLENRWPATRPWSPAGSYWPSWA